MARMVGESLSKELGQPVVIESRPGGGGAVAATSLLQAKPDGYNIVVTTSTTLTLDPQVSKLAFGLDDFTFVATTGEFPEALIALPKSGWTSLDDALKSAKEKGEITYGSSTPLDKMLAAYLSKKSGATLAAVPFNGGAEVVTNVMGGHVDMGYSSGAYYPHAKSGDLTVLALLGENRLASLPNAPTLKELGYDVSSVNHILYIAPKGLPGEVLEKLTKAFAAAAAEKSVVDLMNQRSLNPVSLTGAELDAAMKKQSASYGAILKEVAE
jgi:tripartite-type tricarboxylate transporter receptor subunit TctC